MRLPPSFVPGYVIRGALFWIVLRAVVGAGAAALGGSAARVHLVAVPFLVGAVYLMAAVDDRVRRDRIFLANLGVSPRSGPLLSSAVAAVGEVVLPTLLGVLA